MKNTFKNKISISEFENIQDFINYIETTPTNNVFAGSDLASKREGAYEASFRGTKTYGDAISMLKGGWQSVAQKLEGKLTLATKSQVTKTSPRPTYSMAGYQACVPRYLQGVPESMIYSKRVPVKQKIITLNNQINFLASVSQETIIEEGVKSLSIVAKLEALGYRVKLNAVTCSNSYDGYTQIVKICLKQPSERFSILKMAFPLVNPGMQRRLVFRYSEVNPQTSMSFKNGYGSTVYDARKFFEDKANAVYYIPPFVGDVEEFIKKMELK